MIDALVAERLDDGDGPQPGAIPGAVVLVARNGAVEHFSAHGHAVRYADATGALATAPVPMSADTIFDVASITKLFTATLALKAVEDGLLELDRPVSEHLPDFHAGVTLRHLLVHTSGLPAVRELWKVPGSREERVAAVLASVAEAPPGVRHVYSCVGYLVTGVLLERVQRTPLANLVAEQITGPLGMTDTGYRPEPALWDRIAATEDSHHLNRGVVRGEVHDEASWSLGGTGGNAGIFGTATDLLRFAEMLRGGGTDPLTGATVLSPESVVAMTTNHLTPEQTAEVGYGQGLGPRIADRTHMGSQVSDRSFGHTGFTGTSLTVDPERGLVVIMLANAVHPVRGRTMLGQLRSAIIDAAATE